LERFISQTHEEEKKEEEIVGGGKRYRELVYISIYIANEKIFEKLNI